MKVYKIIIYNKYECGIWFNKEFECKLIIDKEIIWTLKKRVDEIKEEKMQGLRSYLIIYVGR